jgi:hypothetical protein
MAKKGSEPSKLHDLVHYKKKKEVRRKFLAEGYEMRTMLSANALQRSRGLNFTRITNVIQSRWRISRAFVVIRIIRRRGGIIRRRGSLTVRFCKHFGIDIKTMKIILFCKNNIWAKIRLMDKRFYLTPRSGWGGGRTELTSCDVSTQYCFTKMLRARLIRTIARSRKSSRTFTTREWSWEHFDVVKYEPVFLRVRLRFFCILSLLLLTLPIGC